MHAMPSFRPAIRDYDLPSAPITFRTRGRTGGAFGPIVKTFREQSHRVRETGVEIVTHRAERLAGFHRIAEPLFDDQADAGIDRVFFLFAAAAEHHAGNADLLTLNRGDEAVGRRGDACFVPRLRKAGGIVHDSGIATLQANDLAECITGAARSNHFRGERAAVGDGSGFAAEQKHPGGEFEARVRAGPPGLFRS